MLAGFEVQLQRNVAAGAGGRGSGRRCERVGGGADQRIQVEQRQLHEQCLTAFFLLLGGRDLGLSERCVFGECFFVQLGWRRWRAQEFFRVEHQPARRQGRRRGFGGRARAGFAGVEHEIAGRAVVLKAQRRQRHFFLQYGNLGGDGFLREHRDVFAGLCGIAAVARHQRLHLVE